MFCIPHIITHLQFELKDVLQHMHIQVSDADVFQMISEVDEDNSGAIGSYDSLISSFCTSRVSCVYSTTTTSRKPATTTKTATCQFVLGNQLNLIFGNTGTI